MGFLSRVVAEQKASDPLAIWAEMLRAGRTSKAGPTVNLESAFRVAAFFACVRVISQDIAKVPFKVYRESEVDGLTRIKPERDHRLYDLLTVAPNEWTTSFEFRESQAIHAALGNSYAFLNRTIGGISEMILLNPAKVKKKANSGLPHRLRGNRGERGNPDVSARGDLAPARAVLGWLAWFGYYESGARGVGPVYCDGRISREAAR